MLLVLIFVVLAAMTAIAIAMICAPLLTLVGMRMVIERPRMGALLTMTGLALGMLLPGWVPRELWPHSELIEKLPGLLAMAGVGVGALWGALSHLRRLPSTR